MVKCVFSCCCCCCCTAPPKATNSAINRQVVTPHTADPRWRHLSTWDFPLTRISRSNNWPITILRTTFLFLLLVLQRVAASPLKFSGWWLDDGTKNASIGVVQSNVRSQHTRYLRRWGLPRPSVCVMAIGTHCRTEVNRQGSEGTRNLKNRLESRLSSTRSEDRGTDNILFLLAETTATVLNIVEWLHIILQRCGVTVSISTEHVPNKI